MNYKQKLIILFFALVLVKAIMAYFIRVPVAFSDDYSYAMMARSFYNDGNGGSAADAQHIAAELVCLLDRKNERPSIPAIALTVNTSILTAIGNDMGYEHLFSRQVHDLVTDKDVVIGISTSGNSPNVIKALEAAKEKGAKAIAWTGSKGGKMDEMGNDFVLKVPSDICARIQEMHITVGHIMCEVIEKELYGR